MAESQDMQRFRAGQGENRDFLVLTTHLPQWMRVAKVTLLTSLDEATLNKFRTPVVPSREMLSLLNCDRLVSHYNDINNRFFDLCRKEILLIPVLDSFLRLDPDTLLERSEAWVSMKSDFMEIVMDQDLTYKYLHLMKEFLRDTYNLESAPLRYCTEDMLLHNWQWK
jgi:hypothetical protein